MFLYKSTHIDTCIKLCKYRYIGQYVHGYIGLYRQDLIGVSTCVNKNKLIVEFHILRVI